MMPAAGDRAVLGAAACALRLRAGATAAVRRVRLAARLGTARPICSRASEGAGDREREQPRRDPLTRQRRAPGHDHRQAARRACRCPCGARDRREAESACRGSSAERALKVRGRRTRAPRSELQDREHGTAARALSPAAGHDPGEVAADASSGEQNTVSFSGGEAEGASCPPPAPLSRPMTVRDEPTPFGDGTLRTHPRRRRRQRRQRGRLAPLPAHHHAGPERDARARAGRRAQANPSPRRPRSHET